MQNYDYIKIKELEKWKVKMKKKPSIINKASKETQNKINSMIDYAKRNIVRASTSNMAKSRLHQLENIETLEKPVLRTPTPFFKFEFERNPVKDILKVENLKLQAGEKLLCENITFDMQRGDKIALIGPNGIGKTTLLKKLKEFSWGANVKLSYYDQEGKNLNFDNTAMDEVWNRFPKLTPYEVRNILGQVLISGEDVFKKIGVMSGGERARVAFAIMMKEQGNVLLLDEPTNHLDLQSKEELERSLNEFQGSLIIVSHDRYFLNAIPNKIVELSENGLEIYKGNFDLYLEQQKKQELSLKQSEVIVKKNPEVKTEYRSKEQRKQEVKLKQKIKEIEEQIVFNEQEIARLQEDIENNASDYEKISVLCQHLEAIKKENDLFLEELVLLAE
ncbi:MAG: ATP-binding cassette domain-containing protein [Oscillospiraceae bacterium]